MLERAILVALGFDANVALPHGLLVTYLQTLLVPRTPAAPTPPETALLRRAAALLTGALVSPQLLYATHQPNALAVAAIYLAARDVGLRMPACDWWEVFDVDREELAFLVVAMRSTEGSLQKLKQMVPFFGSDGMMTIDMVIKELKRRENETVPSKEL